jgi:DNA polymerase/3'-5' exonuclease PolX
MTGTGQLIYSYEYKSIIDSAFDLRRLILNPFPEDLFMCIIAGSILRKSPTPGDIDILCGTTNEIVRERCSSLIGSKPYVTKISGRFNDIPTQIWFCEPETWGPMLLEITGPRNFNQFLRVRAKKQGLFLSNQGLFVRKPDDTPGERIDNNTEGNIIWIILGRSWIPPAGRY